MCPKTGQLVLAHSARGRVSCVACNGQRLALFSLAISRSLLQSSLCRVYVRNITGFYRAEYRLGASSVIVIPKATSACMLTSKLC